MSPAHHWRLEDGQAQRAASPGFLTPPEASRVGLRPGWNVKLLFALLPPHPDCHAERMWVEVVERRAGPTFIGRLLNEPHYLDSIRAGELVEFGPEHVIGLDAPAHELGYDREAWVAVNRRLLQSGQPPGRVIWNPATECWYAFAGDEHEQERRDGSTFEWSGLDDLVDRFPELHDVFASAQIDGGWDYDPSSRHYVFTPFPA